MMPGRGSGSDKFGSVSSAGMLNQLIDECNGGHDSSRFHEIVTMGSGHSVEGAIKKVAKFGRISAKLAINQRHDDERGNSSIVLVHLNKLVKHCNEVWLNLASRMLDKLALIR